MISKRTDNDCIAKLLPGSVIFSVQGELFRIPCTYLQLNCEDFASMLSSSYPLNDSPIELDDPLEAFRDFRDMLLTPLQSCINPSHPATEELGRLLRLLVLCNKYGAREFEEHIAKFVENLTRQDQPRWDLGADLPITEVMNIAIVVDRPQFFERARQVLVDEVWGAPDSRTVPAVARQPHELLIYAESIGDKELIGFAYYQLLVSGDKTGLTPSLCQTLNRGMTRCGEEWEKIFNSWGQGKQVSGGSLFYCEVCGHGDYISAEETGKFLRSLWPTIARASLPWYDVVGKLRRAVTISAYSPYCCRKSIGPAKRELSRIKKEVYSYFMEEGSI